MRSIGFFLMVCIGLVITSCKVSTVQPVADVDTDLLEGIMGNVLKQDWKDSLDRFEVPHAFATPHLRLPTVHHFELENGLKCSVVSNHKWPRVTIKFQSANQRGSLAKPGIAMLTNELLLAGTSHFSKDQIDLEIDRIAAQMYGSQQGLEGKSSSRHFEDLFSLFAQVITSPSFPEIEIRKLKKQIGSEIAFSSEDQDAIAKRLIKHLAFGRSHPYGKLMSKADVSDVQREDIISCYDELFQPGAGHLVFVGDISAQEAEQLVHKHLSSWKKERTIEPVSLKVRAFDQSELAIFNHTSSTQSNIKISYPIEVNPAHPSWVAFEVVNGILGGSFESRLTKKLRIESGLAFEAYSKLIEDPVTSRFEISTKVDHEKVQEALDLILLQMKGLSTELVGEKELQGVKNYLIGSFTRALEKPSKVADLILDEATYKLQNDYFSTYLQQIESVTSKDVLAAARELLKPNQAAILVVGDSKSFLNGIGQYGDIQFYNVNGEPYIPQSDEDIGLEVDVDFIFRNYLNALGGVQALNEVKDVTMKLEAEAMGQVIEIISIRKYPNKVFEELSMGGLAMQTKIYDGMKLVAYQMGQELPASEAALKDEAIKSLLFPEMHYASLEIECRLQGTERVGKDYAYIIEVVYPSGKISTLYFSTESGYLIKESSTVINAGQEFQQQTSFGTYKQIDGVYFPHEIELTFGPQKMLMEVKEMTINSGVKDSVFEIK